MFFEWLERQRQRPEGERWTIAIAVAAVLTGVIVVAWLPARLVITETNTAPAARQPEEATSDFRETFTQFQTQFSSLRDSLESGITPTGDSATTTQRVEEEDEDPRGETIPSFDGPAAENATSTAIDGNE